MQTIIQLDYQWKSSPYKINYLRQQIFQLWNTRARIGSVKHSSWNQNTTWVYALQMSQQTPLRCYSTSKLFKIRAKKQSSIQNSSKAQALPIHQGLDFVCACARGAKIQDERHLDDFLGFWIALPHRTLCNLVTMSVEVWLPEKSIFKGAQDYHSKVISQLFWEGLKKKES